MRIERLRIQEILDSDLAKKLRKFVFSAGGSDDEMKLDESFRGQPVSPLPLLEKICPVLGTAVVLTIRRRTRGFPRVVLQMNVLPREHIAQVLTSIPMFSCLDKQELEEIIRLTRSVGFEAGQIICRQHEPGDSMFIIATGRAEVQISKELGQFIPVVKLGPANLLVSRTD